MCLASGKLPYVPRVCAPGFSVYTAVFDGVAWSCAQTLETQVASLHRAGLEVRTGRTQGDIDDANDLKILIDFIKASGEKGGLPMVEGMLGRLEAALDALPPPT